MNLRLEEGLIRLRVNHEEAMRIARGESLSAALPLIRCEVSLAEDRLLGLEIERDTWKMRVPQDALQALLREKPRNPRIRGETTLRGLATEVQFEIDRFSWERS